jgi:limonene-1,2-epoxide hydrolase
MKPLLTLILGSFLFLLGCDSIPTKPEQVASTSPNINVGKAMVKAYHTGDWDTYAQYYADSARIWRNKNWSKDPGLTVTEYLDALQAGIQNMENYRFEGVMWQNIIDENDDNWVLFWGVWVAKSALTDKRYEIPVHIVFMMENGKIVSQGDFFNDSQLRLDLMALEESTD